MKCYNLSVIIGCYLFESIYALAQTTSLRRIPTIDLAAPTEAPDLSEFEKRQAREDATCGYLADIQSDPVTCPSGRCALLSIFEQDQEYVGCCSDGGCDVRVTCLEGKTGLDGFTLGCTGRLSHCATYSWVDQDAIAYSCATASTTLLVYTASSTSSKTETAGGPTGGVPTSGGPNDGGSPLGSEYDLATRQRIGAGVGSAVFGCLLLGFFAVFGCLKRPQEKYQAVRREDNHNRQVLEDIQRGAPTLHSEGWAPS